VTFDNYYEVKYNNIPNEFEDYFIEYDNCYHRSFSPSDIRFATPQEKREFLLKNTTNKYNL